MYDAAPTVRFKPRFGKAGLVSTVRKVIGVGVNRKVLVWLISLLLSKSVLSILAYVVLQRLEFTGRPRSDRQ